MKLLLDTHAWLWFVLGNARLSAGARAQIVDRNNIVYVSPASYWEIAIKISLGKYSLNDRYDQFMRRAISGNGFRVLHISPRHTERVSNLPLHDHRDPFDRLLVAQALVEQMTVVSNEAEFAP